jgi:spermidine/putrescine transport system permease protein
MMWVAVAHVGPLLTMARISLLDSYPGPPDATPGLSAAAYTAFLHGPGYRVSLLHSLGLAAATTFATFLLSYPLAYYVAQRVPAWA